MKKRVKWDFMQRKWEWGILSFAINRMTYSWWAGWSQETEKHTEQRHSSHPTGLPWEDSWVRNKWFLLITSEFGDDPLCDKASQVELVVKNLPANAENIRDTGSIPGSGRCPEVGSGNPLQCSCLKNPMDRGAWRAPVYRNAKEAGTTQRLNKKQLYNAYKEL